MLYRRRLEIHLSRTPLLSQSPCSLGMGHRTRAVSNHHAILFNERWTRFRFAAFELLLRKGGEERERLRPLPSPLLVHRSIYRDRFLR